MAKIKKVKLSNGATVEMKDGKIYNVLDDPNNTYKNISIRNGEYVDTNTIKKYQTNDITNAARQQTSLKAPISIDLGDSNSPNSTIELGQLDPKKDVRAEMEQIAERGNGRASGGNTTENTTVSIEVEPVAKPKVEVAPSSKVNINKNNNAKTTTKSKLNKRRRVLDNKAQKEKETDKTKTKQQTTTQTPTNKLKVNKDGKTVTQLREEAKQLRAKAEKNKKDAIAKRNMNAVNQLVSGGTGKPITLRIVSKYNENKPNKGNFDGLGDMTKPYTSVH